jgi:hypothetical protein
MRGTHLVGSLPADGPEAALRQALESVGDGLRYLPDGETGERHHWIIHIIEGLRTRPDLEVVTNGDWSDYEHIPVFRIKRGHTLDGSTLDFATCASSSARSRCSRRSAALT